MQKSWIAAALTIALLLPSHGAAAQIMPPSDEQTEPQAATVEDMAVFAPYVGTFRSEEKTRSSDGAAFHYLIEYSWFDRDQTVLRFRLTLVVAQDMVARPIGEGFYYFDRINDRIGVFGVFPDGRSGIGTMGRFDRATHARSVWIVGTSPDMPPMDVRDSFELIDGDSWRNTTWVRPAGSDEPWQQVGNDTYRRVEDGEDVEL